MGALQSIYGGLTGAGTANQQAAFNRDLQEGDDAQVQGNQLQGQGNGLQTQFGNEYLNQNGLEGGYRGQADSAYSDLRVNPGYSASDAAAIQGNPSAGFQYYNPSELRGDASGYASDLQSAANRGQQYLQAAPTNQVNWQGGINKNLDTAGTEAVGGLQAGLGSAVSGYGDNLNSAVDPSKLTVGSQLNGYQLSPEEAQNIRDVAAQTTQGQYGKMSQQAQLQAEAQGNTSPAALAAIQENLGRQGAIDAGNAASQAELAANQTAANRKLTATQTNLGANQTLAQLQAQNATNLQGAQSNAANQIYGAKQGTAANLANTETQANESIAANQGTAANQAANLGYNAAQTGGAQKIATDTGLQSTGQGLATGADTASSNRATTTANQNIAGQNTYRNYLTGQQGAAQTAAATAGGQQLSAYGGTTSAYGAQHGAINNANASAGNVAVGANSTSQNLDRSLLADGGTVTGPTVSGYDDSTLPKPHAPDAPDIYRDYREQINPEGASGSSSSSTNNLNISTNSSPGGYGEISGNSTGYDPYGTSGGWGNYDYYDTGASGGSGTGYGNGTVEQVDQSITYPELDANGGTSSGGTRATIAERGPEAVLSTDGGARGDGSSVPGNEPGGEQGQYGWQGPAARSMAAGGPVGAVPAIPQYRPPQQRSMQVFNRPTNVTLGTNGSTDTVVPLNPGPNAKITPSQMGIGGQYRQQQPPQAAMQPQPRMPSRYRAATGPKGMVGPQMRPMQSQQYAA